jgi:hypothetical protein
MSSACPCNVLMIYPRFGAGTFWNFAAACELFNVHYPTPPLGLITVAALLPAAWTIRLVDRNTEALADGDFEWADLVMGWASGPGSLDSPPAPTRWPGPRVFANVRRSMALLISANVLFAGANFARAMRRPAASRCSPRKTCAPTRHDRAASLQQQRRRRGCRAGDGRPSWGRGQYCQASFVGAPAATDRGAALPSRKVGCARRSG